jgi:hypothetical protein
MSEAAKAIVGDPKPSSFFAELSKLPHGSHSFLTPARKTGSETTAVSPSLFCRSIEPTGFRTLEQCKTSQRARKSGQPIIITGVVRAFLGEVVSVSGFAASVINIWAKRDDGPPI